MQVIINEVTVTIYKRRRGPHVHTYRRHLRNFNGRSNTAVNRMHVIYQIDLSILRHRKLASSLFAATCLSPIRKDYVDGIEGLTITVM